MALDVARETPFILCFSVDLEAGFAFSRMVTEYILGLSATTSMIDAPFVSHLNLPIFNLFVSLKYSCVAG